MSATGGLLQRVGIRLPAPMSSDEIGAIATSRSVRGLRAGWVKPCARWTAFGILSRRMTASPDREWLRSLPDPRDA